MGSKSNAPHQPLAKLLCLTLQMRYWGNSSLLKRMNRRRSWSSARCKIFSINVSTSPRPTFVMQSPRSGLCVVLESWTILPNYAVLATGSSCSRIGFHGKEQTWIRSLSSRCLKVGPAAALTLSNECNPVVTWRTSR